MNHWLLLVLAIVLEVIATSTLKLSDGFTRLVPSTISALSYAGAFYLLAIVLRSIPVGVAYALWSGAGIVLICLIGWLHFGQRLDAPAIVGVGFIVAGVLIVNLLSKTVSH